MEEKTTNRRFWILLIIGIVIASGLLYGLKLSSEFVLWDDDYLIQENPAIRGLNFANLKMIFTTYDPELYIPVTLFTYQLNYLIGGLHPFIYHFTNLLFHIFNALLVSIIAWYLSREDRWITCMAGLLFAVLPLHTETVMWASARKDVLAAFFALASVWMYFLYHTRSSRFFFFLSVVSFLLGLLSKISIVALPLILILIDWLEHRPIDRNSLVEKLPFFALSLIFGVVALFGKSEQVISSTFMETVLVGIATVLLSIGRMIVPVGLSPLYPYTGNISLGSSIFFLPLIFFAVICVLVFLFRKKSRMPVVVLLSFLLFLAPSFVNFRKGEGDIYLGSDRYAYLASVPVILLIITFFRYERSRLPRRAIDAILMLVIILYAFVSFRQADVWHDSKTLFTHVLAVYPESEAAEHNLGSIYQKEGDFAKAMQHYRLAIAIAPKSVTYANIGDMFRERGMPGESETFYRKALTLKVDSTDAFIGLGLLAMQRQDISNAVDFFRQAKETNPSDFRTYLNLGAALMSDHMVDDAIEEYRLALLHNPQSTTAYFNLAVAYERTGRTDEAIQALQHAINYDPFMLPVLLRLGNLLRANGDRTQAVFYYKQILSLDPQNAVAHKALDEMQQ